MSDQLVKAGVQVDFCTPWKNLEYWAFPLYPEFRIISGSKVNIKKFRRLISKADVVIFSDTAVMILLLTECFLQNKRCLWGLHTDMFNRIEALRLPSFLIHVLYLIGSYFSDITFTTSYIFKEKLKRIGFGIDFVMDQDFKCDDFRKEDDPIEIDNLRKGLLLEGTKYIAMYAGRLSKEKRIELLFPAIPDDVTLVIIGDGPEKENILKMQASHKNVKFILQMVSQNLLRKYYKAADIHVSPSDGETYGMTVRESLYCRTPVVVQNSGGFIEQVRPNVDGLLVDYNNTIEARSCIERSCKNINSFNPEPRTNNVVNLAKFIKNREYAKIEPFARVRCKKFAYFGIYIFQYVIVIGYYIVQFFYSRFIFSKVKKFD